MARKPTSRKKIGIALALVAALVVLALLALPYLVDANRYRDLIQKHASTALGRDVRLGEIKMSLLPVFGVRVDDVVVSGSPEEGGGDLLAARHVRVGARLMSLLRGQLEVTSIVVEGPSVTLVRAADGTWNVQRLLAPDPAGAAASGASGGGQAVQIDTLRVKDGRIQVRDESAAGGAIGLVLVGVDLEVDGFRPDRPFDFRLATGIEEAPGAQLQLKGKAGPLSPAEGQRNRIDAELTVERLDASRLAGILRAVAGVSPGLVGAQPLALESKIEVELGDVPRVALRGVRVRGGELSLIRSPDGSWNLPVAAATDPGGRAGAESTTSVTDLQVSGALIHVRDETAPTQPLTLTLRDLALSLDRLPGADPARIDLSTTLETGGKSGRLTVAGTVGPLTDAGDAGVDLKIAARDLPPALLEIALGPGALEGGGTMTLDLALSGSLPGRFDARGSLGLAGARAQFAGTDGKPRTAAVDATARYDAEVRDGGAAVQLRSLKFALSGNELSVRGTIREEKTLHRVDLELLPARLPAEDLTALAALAGAELPFAFASQTPVELEGRIRGLVGGDRVPEIEGKARLRDFSFRHASMRQPVERVQADVALRGKQIDITGLSGVVGASDLGGRITVEDLERMVVRFDLRCERADFNELFSFLESADAAAAAPGAAATPAPDPLSQMSLDGQLTIGSGTFQELDFADLVATMRLRDSVVTLDPVRMKLYDGSFAGRVSGDLGHEPPVWTIDGQAAQIDTEAFLADNLGTSGLLSGRFTGSIDTRTVGADYEAIVRGLSGKGSAEVLSGRVGKLDVLKTLSKVSGVFGETTLKGLTREIASSGTGFNKMSASVGLDGGRMNLDDILFDAPEFRLTGQGALDLISTQFAGQFRMALSKEISALMRSEKSRAAELFWNSRTQQVELPFGLSGPFDAPVPSIDFKSIAQDAVKDRVRERIGEALGQRLGGAKQPAAGTQGEPADEPPAVTENAAAAEPVPPSDPSTLGGQIRSSRWGGAILARDLTLEGVVRGVAIQSASLSIVDSKGRELQRVDALPDVAAAVAAAADPAVPAEHAWRAKIDGKRLALGKFPLTVKLSVHGPGGAVFETTLQVDR